MGKEKPTVKQCRKMVDSKDWQLNKSLSETNAYLLASRLGSDVNFLVGSDIGQAETIPAHKLILASRSPVFEVMFYGSLVETSDTITIPDIYPEAFRLLLSFMYTESCALLEEDKDAIDLKVVTNALYAGRKYMIPKLVTACEEHIEQNITCEDAPRILDLCTDINDTKLADMCYKYIIENIGEVLKTSGFLDLRRSTLQTILEDENLACLERELLQAVISYAKVNHESSDIITEVKTLCKFIRIPIVPYNQLVSLNLGLSFLSNDELQLIYKYQHGLVGPEHVPFKSKFRNYSVWNRMNVHSNISADVVSETPIEDKNIFTLHLNCDGWTGNFVALSLLGGPYMIRILAFNGTRCVSVTERDFTQFPINQICRETEIVLSTPIKVTDEDSDLRIEVHLDNTEFIYMYNDTCLTKNFQTDTDYLEVTENQDLDYAFPIIVCKLYYIMESQSVDEQSSNQEVEASECS